MCPLELVIFFDVTVERNLMNNFMCDRLKVQRVIQVGQRPPF